MSEVTARIDLLQSHINTLQEELDNLTGEEGKVREFLDALADDPDIEAGVKVIASIIGKWEYWKVSGRLPFA